MQNINNKNQDTKQLLIDISTQLFNEKNFDTVSVNEICERAGVTKGSFYHHFESKYDIPIQQFRQIQNLFFNDYEDSADLPINERLYKVIMWYSEYCTYDKLNVFKNYYKAISNSSKSRMLRKIEMESRVVTEILSLGVMTGVFRKNINIPFYTEMITRFIFSLVYDWTLFNGDIDLTRELAYLYRNTMTILT